MNKTLFAINKAILIASLLLWAEISFAQIITMGRLNLGYPDHSAMSIPKEFTYGNTPYLTMYDNTDEHNLLIYNDNLEHIKTINIRKEHAFNFQLTYQDEEREIQDVTLLQENEQNLGIGFELWLQREKNLNPEFEETLLTITKETNGDSLILFNITESSPQSLKQLYFNYNYFKAKYPKRYWRCKNGNMYLYQAQYNITYTDWHITGTRIEDMQENLRRLLLCNINLNYGVGRTNYYFEASQTLFNSDEQFEYIIPKYTLSEKGANIGYNVITSEPSYSEDETVVLQRSSVVSEKSKLALVGFQVVSENGDIISDITFDNGFEAGASPYYVFILTIGNNTYLAFDGIENNTACTLFYKIDRISTSVKKVKSAPAQMIVSPAIVGRSTPLSVTFSDGNEKGSVINVYSNTGAKIANAIVPAGQSKTQLNISGAPGVYHVTRSIDNKLSENRKIIVR